MRTYTIKTLGCKVNQYESDAIARLLKESGWVPVQADETADVCIINTCTVTGKAAMQSRQVTRQVIRSNPRARIIVAGCYAQTEPDAIKKIKGVHDIIGQADKHRIPQMVLSATEPGCSCPVIVCSDILQERKFIPVPATVFDRRTRPFLKIQDGCDAFCTYCIVPFARGHSRSMLPENVLENINSLENNGYREVVLTGIHLGCYGLDLSPETSLLALMKRIETSGTIDRVRISSIEPCELTEEFIHFVAGSGTFCHHFHIPLQSGDNQILKKMQRPYGAELFRRLITQIRRLIPDAAIGTDILIGFPGETDAAFENTYSLIEELPVTYLHIFPFSPRRGTPASRYPDRVPAEVIKERCKKMRVLGNTKKKVFYGKFIGQKVEILVEEKKTGADDLLKGMTSNYMPVFFRGEDRLIGTLVNAGIDRLKGVNSVYGTLC